MLPVLINVEDGPGTIAANVLGDCSALQSNLLWNFLDASAIDFDRQLRGSILAADASMTNGNNLEGSAGADTFDQHGEVHMPGFDNDFPTPDDPPEEVPEPSVWLLSRPRLLASVGWVAVGAGASIPRLSLE